jgi:hypothetical protein
MVRVLSPSDVSARVVEDPDRGLWRDLEAESDTGLDVARGDLDPLAAGVPEEQDFVRPAQLLGQLSNCRTHNKSILRRWFLFFAA